MGAGLEAGTYTSVELTNAHLDDIEQRNTQSNSFITIAREHALAQAKAADAQRANGDATPLTGIPIAHKDIFCTEGLLTTCGSKMLSNFNAPYNSTMVERLNAAGIVTVGKTNMDEFAMGSSNENSFFGPVTNPWDRSKCPVGPQVVLRQQ